MPSNGRPLEEEEEEFIYSYFSKRRIRAFPHIQLAGYR
jgi:hypothetical protein